MQSHNKSHYPSISPFLSRLVPGQVILVVIPPYFYTKSQLNCASTRLQTRLLLVFDTPVTLPVRHGGLLSPPRERMAHYSIFGCRGFVVACHVCDHLAPTFTAIILISAPYIIPLSLYSQTSRSLAFVSNICQPSWLLLTRFHTL